MRGFTQPFDFDSKPRPPTPEDLFRIGQSNVVVANCLAAWRAGTLTWEAALLTMAVMLARQNVEITDRAVDLFARTPISVHLPPVVQADHPGPRPPGLPRDITARS